MNGCLIRSAFAELDKASACRFINGLSPDKSWRVTVEIAKSPRSIQQNRSLFGIAYPPLCEHLGYRVEEIHEVMCEKFFGKVEYEIFGELRSRPRRTTTTDDTGKRDVIGKPMFNDFYAMVQEVGASIGIYVPSPNEDSTW